jgi:hypothetical protein
MLQTPTVDLLFGVHFVVLHCGCALHVDFAVSIICEKADA